jgi:hypothetical protein
VPPPATATTNVSSGAGTSPGSSQTAGSTQGPATTARAPTQADRRFPSGFQIKNDRFWSYFTARGGASTFGHPISREFRFLGFPVQFFQGHVLQQMPDGSVAVMNLLQDGLMPATRINGSTFPSADQALIDGAPSVSAPGYGERIVQFTREHAPNQLNDRPVRFFDTFNGTVDMATAFPNGDGSPSLLPLINLEVWGTVVSAPLADPANHDFVYQRFQRSIMHYRHSCQCTERVLLADWFKSVITGQNLPPDLGEEMAGSPFIHQYDNRQPLGLARPQELLDTDMRDAFEPE